MTVPHVAKIHALVNKIWPLGDKMILIDVFVIDVMTVKFRIKDANTRSQILRRGMWYISNIPMVVSKWAPEEEEEEEEQEIKLIPMWVVMKNVPKQMFSWEGLGFIASAVGHQKHLHPDTLLCKSFVEAKVFVEADMTKELPTSHHFKSKLGVDFDVQFKYPWLPNKCNLCLKWGHEENACGKKKKKGKANQQDQVNNTAPGNSTTSIVEKEVETSVESAVEAVDTVVDKNSASVEANENETDALGNIAEMGVEEPSLAKDGLVRLDKNVLVELTEGTDLASSVTETTTDLPAPVTEELSWLNVSPSKRGWSPVKPVENNVISPSHFAVLNEESEDKEEDINYSQEKGETPGKAEAETGTISQKDDGESEEGEIIEN